MQAVELDLLSAVVKKAAATCITAVTGPSEGGRIQATDKISLLMGAATSDAGQVDMLPSALTAHASEPDVASSSCCVCLVACNPTDQSVPKTAAGSGCSRVGLGAA